MLKKYIYPENLLPIAMLASFVVSWWLSQWSTLTTVLVGAGHLIYTGIAASTLHKQRIELEHKSKQTIEKANQRLRELTNSYDAIEQELQSLRADFSVTEKVKERFLANISHEIRTPMNGIFGMTELLGKTQLNDRQLRYTDSIKRSTESLLNIVNDILDFSKIHSGELQIQTSTFSLADLIEDVCKLYVENAEQQGIELICDVSGVGPQAVNGDPARVRQILQNLVSNAVKFTEHGEVLVSAAYNADTKEYEISVADTGIGIAAEIQDHIFKEFTQADGSTTRKFGGTGLGLSISSKLAALMGGELKLRSKVGTGSTFSFNCGLVKTEETLSQSEQSKLTNISALVVDDNQTNSAILVHQLEQWGINSTSVDSGTAALAALQHSVASNKPFDIAILDLNMPNMDGLELASQIQSNPAYTSLKLMMLTSSLTDMSSEELLGIGISSVLTKPARQALLYNAISSMVEDSVSRHTGQTETQQEAVSIPRKPKILLTEDNPINQEVACIMLESIGCEVEIAENGSEAVDALANKQFDLVFMDCQMPVMDGFEATRTIRSQSSQNKIPVVALTANAMDGDREQCLASGMDDYLSKPVNQSELQGALQKWLQQSLHSTEQNTHQTTTDTTEVLASMNFEFDESALDAIKALQRPGKPDILAKIVNMYLQKTPELIADIENGVAANDAARVKMAAHTLKSSSAYLGATTLADRCNKLEAKAANEDLSDVASDISEISMGYDAICQEITKFA